MITGLCFRSESVEYSIMWIRPGSTGISCDLMVMGSPVLSGTHLDPFGFLGLLGSLLTRPDSSGSFYDLLCSYGLVWAILDSSGLLWDLLDSSGFLGSTGFIQVGSF